MLRKEDDTERRVILVAALEPFHELLAPHPAFGVVERVDFLG